MTKAKRYDTVVLLEPISTFQQGEKGAVVEVYSTPYEGSRQPDPCLAVGGCMARAMSRTPFLSR